VAEGTPHDRTHLVELLETFLLGSEPTLTGLDIAQRVGISIDIARERWRSLGFTAVDDDEVAFTEADLEAMRLTQKLHDLGVVDPGQESALVRTMGRSFARLADWQIGLLGNAIDLQVMDLEEISEVMSEVTPTIESLQAYVWRRHILNAAARQLLGPAGEDNPPMAVGFADIVGYTQQTRALGREALARLVEDFEDTALRIVSEERGRIIKTIGDEVLFAADTPEDAAAIGLRLVEGHLQDPDFPQLRVGLAWGQVLHRLGDVFGPVVNVAARLTSVARPGRVLVDRDLAERLEDDQRFRLRRLRRTSVKGYRRLEPWNLRRAGDESVDLGPASALMAERSHRLLDAVDEMQNRAERSVLREGLEEPEGR
jgi:adenylate cyclase